MKLAHYQIAHIKSYIDNKNIWYQDIKDELLDHMICGVEREMEENETSFADAVSKIALEVKPLSLQRAKLKIEHLRTFKELNHTVIDLAVNKTHLIIICILIAVFLTAFTDTLSNTINFYNTAVILALVYNFTFRTWRNKEFKPLQNTLFTSRMNALSVTAILTIQFLNLTLAELIEATPWLFMLYTAIFNIYVLASFKILNKSFLDLKNHGATQ